MSSLLVDAGPLVALGNPADEWHREAEARFANLVGPLVTTWPVLTEAAYLLAARPSRVSALFQMVEEGILQTHPLGDADAGPLRELVDKYRDMPLQLADASLLHVAALRGISRVYTYDAHFLAIAHDFRTAAGAG